jgi:hypothetical protein
MPMPWGCGCTKGGKITIQDGNPEPLYTFIFVLILLFKKLAAKKSFHI